MSLDLSVLFAMGQGLAREAIRTSGTRVRLERVVRSTAPVTLEPQEDITVLGEHPAIVGAVQPGNVEPIPGVEARAGDWRITLLPTVPTPDVGVDVVVVRCRDQNLLGRRAKVLGDRTSSAGAVLTVYARPGGPS